MAKQSLVSEFWEFTKVRKKFWLVPLIEGSFFIAKIYAGQILGEEKIPTRIP